MAESTQFADSSVIGSRASSLGASNSHIDDGNARPAIKPRERRRRHRVITSCLECRRRKLKCDKGEVCLNCKSYGRQCIYMSTAADDSHIRRKLTQMKDARDSLDQALVGANNKETEQRKQARRDQLLQNSKTPIAAVEDELDDDSRDSDGEDFLEPTPLAIRDAAYAGDERDDPDDLGFLFGRMRLGERVGGLFRPRIGDELGLSLHNQPARSVAAAKFSKGQTKGEASSSHSTPELTFVPSMAIIFGAGPSNDEWVTLIPPRAVSDALLYQYWLCVHPVARTIHRPSFAQRYETLWELIDGRDYIPASLGALVFSVLLSSVISMSAEDIVTRFHDSKQEMSSRLQLGTELALSKSNLLRSNKMEVLQALITYMLPMCLEISRAHSALVGLAIRLAECMGYHRDPAEYNFSPVECQVRRLIWYQICYLDLKTSEVQGPRPFVQSTGYSCKLPLDSNLHASSPSSQVSGPVTRWNDLVFSAIRFECQEMQRSCLILCKRVDLKKLSLTEAVSRVQRFDKEIHRKYDAALNEEPQQPLQHAARVVMKLFISLLYLTLLHRYMNSVTYSIPDRLRQIVLIKGTEALEAAVELETASDLHQWAWYSFAYQRYHTALLLLFEVFTFPLRKHADRIWHCLDFIFASPLANLKDLPPLGNPPKYHEVLAQRDVKGRYLLGTITEGMQQYHGQRGLRSPVTITDSMILISPKKAGDDSDPTLPLNYAYEKPPAEPNPIVLGSITGENTITSNSSGQEVSLEQQNPTNAENLAQEPFLPVIEDGRFGIPTDCGGIYNPLLDSNYLHPSLHPSATVSQSVSVSAYTPQTSGDGDNQEMLDIDWELWDSMFPPGIFDGHLDLSDVDMQEYAVA